MKNCKAPPAKKQRNARPLTPPLTKGGLGGIGGVGGDFPEHIYPHCSHNIINCNQSPYQHPSFNLWHLSVKIKLTTNSTLRDMRPDLEGLPITPGEVRHLTGIPLINDLKSNLLNDLFVGFTYVLPITIFILLGFNLLQLSFNPILILILILITTIIVGLLLFMQKQKLKNNNHLMNLITELEKHNNLIGNIHVLDQLEAVGNPVSMAEREKVLEALKMNRNNLERALKTERILRENPQFRPEQFEIDLTALQGLQVNETATEYGRWLNEALEISLSVQKEMISLQQRGK